MNEGTRKLKKVVDSFYLPGQTALKLTAAQSCPFSTGQMDKANELCIPCGITEHLSASLTTH